MLLDALAGGSAALLRPSAKHGLVSAAWGLVLRLLGDGRPAAPLSAVRGMPSPGRAQWVCLPGWHSIMRLPPHVHQERISLMQVLLTSPQGVTPCLRGTLSRVCKELAGGRQVLLTSPPRRPFLYSKRDNV